MRLVIDTNVLMESITSSSPYHQIFQSIIAEKNHLVISNEILMEYFEIFERIFSIPLQKHMASFFNYSLSVIQIDPHYRFNLIHKDEDDNKFVDCAICGNCDYIITSDRHFKTLDSIDFPKIKTITPEEFIKNHL